MVYPNHAFVCRTRYFSLDRKSHRRVFFEMRFQGSDSGDRETAKRLRVLDRSNASVSSEFDRKDHLTEGRLKNSLPGARISEYLNI